MNSSDYDDQRYIRDQLFKARARKEGDILRMRLDRENGGITGWVEIPDHVQNLLTAVAALTISEAASLSLLINRVAAGKTFESSEITTTDMRSLQRMELGLDMNEATEGECRNGSPTCTPEDPCVVCHDAEGDNEAAAVEESMGLRDEE